MIEFNKTYIVGSDEHINLINDTYDGTDQDFAAVPNKYLYSSKIILSQTNLEDKLHSFISESLETLNKNTRS